jgi:uncharacterized membrane protein YfcA
MAFGVISTSFLLASGIAPAPASAAVRLAKIFVGAASGLAHWRIGNVDRVLCRRLVLPGMVGGAIGAFAVSYAPVDIVKPLMAFYLLAMGLFLVSKGLRQVTTVANRGPVGPLGFVGGLVDAMGGGWGPVVTSTLLARGHEPRLAIGTTNLAEFFVAMIQSAMFFAILGLVHLNIVAALVIGGVAAAPLAARLTRSLPERALIFAVGFLVSALSLYNLWLAL